MFIGASRKELSHWHKLQDMNLFKRLTLQSNANKMHEHHLGKLASQSDFLHSVFAAPTARPFERVNI